MNSSTVNVGCTMPNKQIIGPYFFHDKTASRQNYLQMLFLSNYGEKTLNNKMIFQQDDAPPHFSKEVSYMVKRKLLMQGELIEVVQFLGHQAL